MKTIFTVLILTFANSAIALTVQVTYRSNLAYTASSLGASSRIKETFDAMSVDPSLDKLIKETITRTTLLLPTKYLPSHLDVFVEDNATFTDLNGRSEYLPLSMFLTVQLPIQNAIRVSNFDMKEMTQLKLSLLTKQAIC